MQKANAQVKEQALRTRLKANVLALGKEGAAKKSVVFKKSIYNFNSQNENKVKMEQMHIHIGMILRYHIFIVLY